MIDNKFQELNQLNPFELKAEISKLLSKLEGISDLENYEVHYRTLDAQTDKKIIVKLLFKEVNNLKNDGKILKFLLKRYATQEELIEKLWAMIKSNLTSNSAKIFALDLLRDIDTNWSYDTCDTYLDNPDEFVDEDTKRLLNTAIINPEVQIDFLDFLNSLPAEDQIILLKSLGEDYSKDELANIMIPVFLSKPESEVGKVALDILGNTKSQLAYHALISALDFAPKSIIPIINKNISTLKIAGIRDDNSVDFYKKLLENTKPYRFCITYPDGHGNIAHIISRINKSGKVQFVAIVTDDYHGIRDCFGFNEITKFECNTIIDRFYKEEKQIDLDPISVKILLREAEIISNIKNCNIPYEYICWKNIFTDIDCPNSSIEDILASNLKKKPITIKELEAITKSDFMQHWFLDKDYSDEFEDFLSIIEKSNSEKFDELINENLYKVFYDEEHKIWTKRLLTVAYIKYKEGLIDEAENIYSLYFDEKLKEEFLKNILRISIYQYYFNLKVLKDENAKKIVEDIEKMWVK